MSTSRRPVVFAFIALAMVIALGCIFNADGAFFVGQTHADALWQLAGFGVLACGMTVVILTGGIDLAVGSIVALVGVTCAGLVMKAEMHAAVAVPLGVLAGTLAGGVSGVLVGFWGLQAFVATLAMMAFARGLAKYICQLLVDGAKITKYPTPAGM